MRATKKQKEEIRDVLFDSKGDLLESIRLLDMYDFLNAEKVYEFGLQKVKGRRFMENLPINQEYLKIAQILEWKYIKGNDAPRGGKAGDYFCLSRKKNIVSFLELLNSIQTKVTFRLTDKVHPRIKAYYSDNHTIRVKTEN